MKLRASALKRLVKLLNFKTCQEKRKHKLPIPEIREVM